MNIEKWEFTIKFPTCFSQYFKAVKIQKHCIVEDHTYVYVLSIGNVATTWKVALFYQNVSQSVISRWQHQCQVLGIHFHFLCNDLPKISHVQENGKQLTINLRTLGLNEIQRFLTCVPALEFYNRYFFVEKKEEVRT